jgi:LEA14-like dessication related protein
MRVTAFLLLLLFAVSCLPKNAIELRDVRNLQLNKGEGGFPVLVGDAVFYNPNSSRMKLKQIKVDVFVDEKKSARVDHELNIVARGNSEFTVPLTVQLEMKDIGLLDAIKSIFGGKTYQIRYLGDLKVNVNGIPFKVPIDHKEEFKLRF